MKMESQELSPRASGMAMRGQRMPERRTKGKMMAIPI